MESIRFTCSSSPRRSFSVLSVERSSMSASCLCRASPSKPRAATTPISASRCSPRACSATGRFSSATTAAPAHLRGRRIGLPEYQLTACVWVRILLEEDHGVAPQEILWVRGGLEQLGREEKIPLDLPRSVSLQDAPPDRTLSMMLAAGEL